MSQVLRLWLGLFFFVAGFNVSVKYLVMPGRSEINAQDRAQKPNFDITQGP